MGSEYFQAHQLIEYLSVLVMLLGAAAVLAAPGLSRLSTRWYLGLSAMFFLITRVGLLAVVGYVLDHGGGPDKAYWALHGESALEGLLPFVDYSSGQGPLFSYLLAPAFMLFDKSVAPVVLFIIFDLLTFALLHRLTEDRRVARGIASLYLLSPISWFVVVRYGQDESIGAFLLVLLLILAKRGRENVIPILAGLGIAATKVLFLLPVCPILMHLKHRWRASLVTGSILACAYLPFAVLGGNLFQWIPSTRQWRGPSVWQALGLSADTYWQMAIVVFVALTVVLTALVVLKTRTLGTTGGILLLYSGMMITSPKGWYTYALLVLPLLCIRVMTGAKRLQLILFSAYSFALVFYAYICPALQPRTPSLQHLLAMGTVLFILGYHCYLLASCLKPLIAQPPNPASSPGLHG
jgi:hypothetical protein